MPRRAILRSVRKASQIVLVVVGGGLAVGSMVPLFSRSCREDQTPGRPNADTSCTSRSGSGGWHGSSFWGGSSHSSGGGATAVSSSSSVSRGGFGSSGAHASAGS